MMPPMDEKYDRKELGCCLTQPPCRLLTVPLFPPNSVESEFFLTWSRVSRGEFEAGIY